jgi:hypothetical protein
MQNFDHLNIKFKQHYISTIPQITVFIEYIGKKRTDLTLKPGFYVEVINPKKEIKMNLAPRSIIRNISTRCLASGFSRKLKHTRSPYILLNKFQ